MNIFGRLFVPLIAATVLVSCKATPKVEVAETKPTVSQDQEPPSREPGPDFIKFQWLDATALTIEGKGWTDSGSPYDRLPARAEVFATPAVWNLSHHSAGIAIRFVTDSSTIAAAWDGGEAMNHMAATGNCGLDLYRRSAEGWEFVAVGRPNRTWTERVLKSNLSREKTEYLLYLPLYSTVTELRIGVDKDSAIIPAPPRPEGRDKPIVFYGTSIVQGGCASRAGMCHPAILGRWFDREVINLGFSGSGKMEPELAQLFTEIDASVFVLDCLPNMTDEMTRDRIVPFVRILRDARPDMPIVFVESPTKGEDNVQNVYLNNAVEQLRAEGQGQLYMVRWQELWAGRENPTVDGVHPTDLGFFRMAEAHEPVLRGILAEDRAAGR